MRPIHKCDDFICQELISEADLDGDGNINYEEFITMLFKVGSELYNICFLYNVVNKYSVLINLFQQSSLSI